MIKIYFLGLLFFPMNFFYFFFPFMLILAIMVIMNDKKLTIDKEGLTVFSLLMSYLSVGAFFRLTYYEYSDYRDYIEIGRFVPFFLILIYRKSFNKIGFISFLSIIKAYIIIDFCVSYLQFNNFSSSFLNLIQKMYSNDLQVENSLNISNRALGLSANPSEHGIFILVLITILIIDYLKSYKGQKINLLFCLLGNYSILTSQSQTAFIGIALLNLILFFYFFTREKNKKRFYFYFSFIFIVIVYLIFKFISQMRYLSSLFELGLSRGSYTKREEKLSYLIEVAFEELKNFYLGWGKSFFGDWSTSMDNEHLYIFLVYGPLLYLLFIVKIIKFAWRLSKARNTYNQIFIILLIIGIPLSWPSSYFLTPKIFILLAFFYVNFYVKKNENITIIKR